MRYACPMAHNETAPQDARVAASIARASSSLYRHCTSILASVGEAVAWEGRLGATGYAVRNYGDRAEDALAMRREADDLLRHAISLLDNR